MAAVTLAVMTSAAFDDQVPIPPEVLRGTKEGSRQGSLDISLRASPLPPPTPKSTLPKIMTKTCTCSNQEDCTVVFEEDHFEVKGGKLLYCLNTPKADVRGRPLPLMQADPDLRR